MDNASLIESQKLSSLDTLFKKRQRRLYLRILVFASLFIFIVETSLMVLFSKSVLLPNPIIQVLDGFLLILLLLPFSYFAIVRPISQNIEDHYQTTKQLLQSSELLERFFCITETLIAYMDADFNFIRVNQAYAKPNQMLPEDFVGKNHFDLFPNEDNKAIFDTVVKSGQPVFIKEKPFEFPDHPEYGITYWDWTLQPVKNTAGVVEGLILSLLDVTVSRRAKDKLTEFGQFPLYNPNPVLRVDGAGVIGTANPVAINLGLTSGIKLTEVIPGLNELDIPNCISTSSHHEIQTQLGQTIYQWSIQGSPDLGMAFVYGTDITRIKKTEAVVQTRLSLMEYANSHTLDDLLQFTLDQIEKLTGSTIGFFHFVDADQQSLWLQTWSTNTLQKMCSAVGKYQHYSLNEAGVWTDCIRTRGPVIHNDYPSLLHRKGMPEGHAVVNRELTVPIFRDEKIVAILGIGNKAQDYTDTDLDLAATMADFAWDVVEHKQAEAARLESEAQMTHLYEAEKRAHQIAETLRDASQALSVSLNTNTVFETLLDYLAKVVLYDSAHIVLYDDQDYLIVRMARGEDNWEPQERLLGRRFDLEDASFVLPLLRESEILSYPDTREVQATSFFKSHPKIRSWLGIPLLAGEQVIGICGLEHTSPGFFTDDYTHWAYTLTRQAAVAIHNAWLFEQVQVNRERLKALSRRLVEVQELERHHIARELHDEAGQTLASVMVGLHMIERESADQQAVIARCREVKQIADNVLENLHRLSVDLRPAALDHLGLEAALRQHAEMVSDQHKLPVQFVTVGKIERLPGDIETAVYRIVQEALTNIVRHAQATRVDILLERQAASIMVVVEDNGMGMEVDEPLYDRLGLVGMRERADMLGGTLSVESTPGKGTTILLEVPWQFES